MNDLTRTKFFILLTRNSQEVANEEMRNAYVGLLKEINNLNQSEIDYSNVYRELNLTRIEFVYLQYTFNTSRGKNALKNIYLQKAISVIDSELVLLETRYTHPERFVKEQKLSADGLG